MKSPIGTVVLLFIAISCQQKENKQAALVVIGATIIDGSGSAPIRDAVMVIRNGQVEALGTRDEVESPEGAVVYDATGKFITPGLINAHGHVGDVLGIEPGHYSRENIIDNLLTYARYGVTTVVSLGGDKKDAVPLRAVLDSGSNSWARLFIAGDVITGSTPEEARAVVDRNHQMGVDFMKIRVDDNLGTATKMSEEIYTAVIRRSHELGYKVATHMYYLDDAKKLLQAGSDLMAHSVRDVEVDDEFISLMKRGNICYCPTLTRELSTFVYGDTPAFFSDPFFAATYDSASTLPLMDPQRQQQVRNSKSAIAYKQQLPTVISNLKKIADSGITVAFGTDSGVATRFIGYFEHLELEMMQEAGLSPNQILQSATANAAKCLELKKLGTLMPGNWADFLVLEVDPLTDIRNLRQINAVFIGGEELVNP